MASLGEKTVEVKVFLAGDFKKALVLKNEVGSVDGSEGKHRSNPWCYVYKCNMGVKQGLKLK